MIFRDPIRALGAADWPGFLDFIPQSVEAVGAVGGLPVDFFKCKAKAETVATLKAAGAPKSEIESARAQIDRVASIAALLQLLAGFPTSSSAVRDRSTPAARFPSRGACYRRRRRLSHRDRCP